MFFLILIKNINSFAFNSNILEITDKNFNRLIEKRLNHSVIFLMFHGENCPACRQTYPAFSEAAELGLGMIKFAHVDANRAQQLSAKYQIRSIPTFKIFHTNGETHYSGDRTSRSFLNAASKYLVDKSLSVNESWYPNENSLIDYSTILFSDKSITPPLWSAISCNLSNTSISVGFTNNKNILKKFNITKTPTIIFINKGNIQIYQGKLSFNDVRNQINNTFYELLKPTPTPTPIPPPSSHVDSLIKFESTCKLSSKYCIIETLSIQSLNFTILSNKYKNDPLRFINCGEKCPFIEMKNGYWIFHPKKDVAMFAIDLIELKILIEKLIQGVPKWIPLNSLLNKEL